MRQGKKLFENFSRRGEWVELLFMTVAAGLGFNVAKPWGESGRYDVATEHEGIFHRIQVKSTEMWLGTCYLCQLYAYGERPLHRQRNRLLRRPAPIHRPDTAKSFILTAQNGRDYDSFSSPSESTSRVSLYLSKGFVPWLPGERVGPVARFNTQEELQCEIRAFLSARS